MAVAVAVGAGQVNDGVATVQVNRVAMSVLAVEVQVGIGDGLIGRPRRETLVGDSVIFNGCGGEGANLIAPLEAAVQAQRVIVYDVAVLVAVHRVTVHVGHYIGLAGTVTAHGADGYALDVHNGVGAGINQQHGHGVGLERSEGRHGGNSSDRDGPVVAGRVGTVKVANLQAHLGQGRIGCGGKNLFTCCAGD